MAHSTSSHGALPDGGRPPGIPAGHIDPDALINRENTHHDKTWVQFNEMIMDCGRDLAKAAERAEIPLQTAFIWMEENKKDRFASGKKRPFMPRGQTPPYFHEEEFLNKCYEQLGPQFMKALKEHEGDFGKALHQAQIPAKMLFAWSGDLRKKLQINIVAQAAENKSAAESERLRMKAREGLDYFRAIKDVVHDDKKLDRWIEPVKAEREAISQRDEQLRDCLMDFWYAREKAERAQGPTRR